MKSKVVKQDVLPETTYLGEFNTKPKLLFTIILILGLILILIVPKFVFLGLSLVSLSLYIFIFIKDKELIKYNDQYMVIYNYYFIDLCTILYFDEMIGYHYYSLQPYDNLRIYTNDGNHYDIRCYSKNKIIKIFTKYNINNI